MRLRAAALAVCLAATVCAGKEIQMDEPPPKDAAKEAVEEWFSKQTVGTLGVKFLEKVKCEAFYKVFDQEHPKYYEDFSKTKMHVVNLCNMQRNVERDRRDLQAYAVGYFKDPEETELSTCEEFADDFVSEYSSFKGHREEAVAYCGFFREDGNLNALRTVQTDHKSKTRNMDDAIKTAKQIHEDLIEKQKGPDEL